MCDTHANHANCFLSVVFTAQNDENDRKMAIFSQPAKTRKIVEKGALV
jgi:hypothetical protein